MANTGAMIYTSRQCHYLHYNHQENIQSLYLKEQNISDGDAKEYQGIPTPFSVSWLGINFRNTEVLNLSEKSCCCLL